MREHQQTAWAANALICHFRCVEFENQLTDIYSTTNNAAHEEVTDDVSICTHLS